MKLCKNWLKFDWNPSNKNINFIYSISNEPFYLYRFIMTDTFKSYDKILYLDTDILIASNTINDLFDEYMEKDILYVIPELKNDYNDNTVCLKNKQFTISQQIEFRKRNISPFNNGQFMFLYSLEMKTHFDNVINIIKSNEPDIFIDQQAMNHYFNSLFLSKHGTLEKYTQLFAKDYINTDKKCIMHFCGHIHDGEIKEDFMLNFLKLNNIILN